MATLTDYKGLDVVEDATGDGGIVLTDNFKELADRAPYQAASSPGVSDDSTKGFAPGDQWLNTATQVLWACVSNGVGAAIWKSLFKRSSTALELIPSETTEQVTVAGKLNVGTAQAGAGTASVPAIRVGTTQTGIYEQTGSLGLIADGVERWRVDNSDTLASISGGGIQTGSGTASSPGLRFAADTNTGVYLSAADTLAVSTGGTRRLQCDANGRVQIGTSAASNNAQLTVAVPLANNPALSLNSGPSIPYASLVDKWNLPTSPEGNAQLPFGIFQGNRQSGIGSIIGNNVCSPVLWMYSFSGNNNAFTIARKSNDGDPDAANLNDYLTPLVQFRNNGRVGVGTTNPGGMIDSRCNSTSTKGIISRRISSAQTATLYEAQDESGNALWSVGPSGTQSVVQPQGFTVATLPTAGKVGRFSFATNGRKAGEGTGAGTGCPVWDDGSQWRTFYDNTSVLA